MTRLPDVPRLDVADLRSLVSDAQKLKRGTELFDTKGVLIPSRYRNKLLADVKGSGPQPYKVAVLFESEPLSIAA